MVTLCLRGIYPFYIVTYYINWATTSWTYGKIVIIYTTSLYSSAFGSLHSSLFPVWFIGKDEDLWRGTAFIWPPLHLLSELKIDVTLRIRVANLFLA